MALPGRPKGAKNKRNLLVETIADRFKTHPFEILMHFANGDWQALGYDNECYVMENASGGTKIGYTITPEMRLSATKEACQYLISKRKEEPEEDNSIEVMDIEEKKKFLEQAKEEIKRLEEEVIKEEI